MKNEEIFNIKSNYCMKTIFSYLDFNYILKLIKYNNKIKNILNISLKNYNKKASCLYLKRKYKPICLKEKEYEESYRFYLLFPFSFVFGCLIGCLIGCLAYYFDLSETKIFILSIFFMCIGILYLTFIGDYIREKYEKIIIIENYILLIGFCLFLFISIPLLIKTEYNTIKSYLILLFNIIIDLVCIIRIYKYKVYIYIKTRIITKYILLKINNIKIIESELSSNFQKMTKQKKKKYIFKIIPNIKIAITKEQIDSINFIKIKS